MITIINHGTIYITEAPRGKKAGQTPPDFHLAARAPYSTEGRSVTIIRKTEAKAGQ